MIGVKLVKFGCHVVAVADIGRLLNGDGEETRLIWECTDDSQMCVLTVRSALGRVVE